MRINGVSVNLCPVDVEQVDGAFILRDPVSGNVTIFNQTASLVWETIVEHSRVGTDVCTRDCLARIAQVFGTEQLKEDEVREDVDAVIADFFGAGLLREE